MFDHDQSKVKKAGNCRMMKVRRMCFKSCHHATAVVGSALMHTMLPRCALSCSAVLPSLPATPYTFLVHLRFVACPPPPPPPPPSPPPPLPPCWMHCTAHTLLRVPRVLTQLLACFFTPWRKDAEFFREIEPNCWDWKVRLQDMDRDNIDVQVRTVPASRCLPLPLPLLARQRPAPQGAPTLPCTVCHTLTNPLVSLVGQSPPHTHASLHRSCVPCL